MEKTAGQNTGHLAGQFTGRVDEWIKLHCLRGVSDAQKITAITGPPGPDQAIRATPADWVRWFPRLDSNKVHVCESALQKTSDWLSGGERRRVLTYVDADYPDLLRQQVASPLLLFVQGNHQILNNPAIAAVGSRRASPAGLKITDALVAPLAQAGVTIVSGLAAGIDAQAHRASVGTTGNTIAVLGTGPDREYPASNRKLHKEIIDGGGALVTEFTPGTAPLRSNFPRRNRIISGLAQGVVVVEAALKSGSLITARLAAEQGRTVCAVPGPVLSPGSAGCHQLIRNGACLVTSTTDIAEEVFPQFELGKHRQGEKEASPRFPGPENDARDRLLALIGYEPTSMESLACTSGLTANEVSSILLALELDQVVARSIDGTYTRLR